MTDLYDQHDTGVVVDAADDPIVPLADAILLEPRELLARVWLGFRGEPLDSSGDLATILDGEGLQLFAWRDGGRVQLVLSYGRDEVT